jgi:hypothetical protein
MDVQRVYLFGSGSGLVIEMWLEISRSEALVAETALTAAYMHTPGFSSQLGSLHLISGALSISTNILFTTENPDAS